MQLLQELEIAGLGCLADEKIRNLTDINVLIGPNNCGKSHILSAIAKLGKLQMGRSPHRLPESSPWLAVIGSEALEVPTAQFEEADVRHGGKDVRIKYHLCASPSLEILAATLGRQPTELARALVEQTREARARGVPVSSVEVKRVMEDLSAESDFWALEVSKNGLPEFGDLPFSPFLLVAFRNALKSRIVMCHDARLRDYNGLSFEQFFGASDLGTDALASLATALRGIVDPSILEFLPYSHKVRQRNGFEATFQQLGSGCRSLLCLLVEVIRAPAGSIVLLDEPELGLNPSAKNALWTTLVEQARTKQFFIATHDPAFTNPAMWPRGKDDPRVSVYIHSPHDSRFVKTNSAESPEVAGTFAGFLTHTSSPKPFHLYVEGRTDAQTFRCLIDKLLWKQGRWPELEDRIEVYHLGGKFWEKLVSTLPGSPYRRLVVLDGDYAHKPLLERLRKQYGLTLWYGEERLPDVTLAALRKATESADHYVPVYLLGRTSLDKYFTGDPPGKASMCIRAHKMNTDDVPYELCQLLDVIFESAKAN
jgi:energy-coupling factor transporter ATP-binding protein EcfA2